jgi:hypothetical protein
MPDGNPRLGMRVHFSRDFYNKRLIPRSAWTGTITGKLKSMLGQRTRYMVSLTLNSELRLERPKSTPSRKKWNLTRATNEPSVSRLVNACNGRSIPIKMAVSAWGALTAANTVHPGCYISACVTTIGATAVPRSVSCIDFGCVSVLRFSARGCMQEQTERWKQLCAQTAVEQNPEQRLDLIRQNNDLFPSKRRQSGRPDDSEQSKVPPKVD